MWREINPDQLGEPVMKQPRVVAEYHQDATTVTTMNGGEIPVSDEVTVRVSCPADRVRPALEALHRAVADVERQLGVFAPIQPPPPRFRKGDVVIVTPDVNPREAVIIGPQDGSFWPVKMSMTGNRVDVIDSALQAAGVLVAGQDGAQDE